MPNKPFLTPRFAMLASLVVALVMLVGKMAAYWLTGSTAIFSDAAESVVHLFATGFAAFSLWYAVRPPDETHPYGHGKIAYVSAGFEGGLILVAALMIVYSAVMALIEGPELRQLSLGLLITFVLALVNLALGWTLVRVGRKHRSLVLVANGKHVLTDMWTSFGVVAGVGLVWGTGLGWLDPVVAIIMAINILWTGFRLMRASVLGLMERADTTDTAALLDELDHAIDAGHITSYHQLRHRRVDAALWVEYHLLFPDDLRITEAHARSHEVEAALVARFPDDAVYVTAHLEPDTHDAAHPDGHAEPADPLRRR